MIKLMYIFLSLSLISGGELSKSLTRKVDKSVQRSYDSEGINKRQLLLNDNFPERPDPGLLLYTLEQEGLVIGYLIVTTAKGRHDYFDYMVIYEPDLSIRIVEVLVYRSDHGQEISNKKWLKQFVGNDACNLEYDVDIDAISGATYSASSITEDIQTLCNLMRSLRESDFL